MKYNPTIAITTAVTSIISIGYLDYKTGFRFSLFPLYLVPLAVTAWKEQKKISVNLSVLASIVMVIKDLMSDGVDRHSLYFYWDMSIKVILLFFISYGLCKIRELLREKTRSNQELRLALSEISELRSMIPICAWCHSVRNDKGFYEKIEVYLSHLTGATLTHGICPACTEKFYGDLIKKSEDEATRDGEN